MTVEIKLIKVVMLEDYKHGRETLWKGNSYPLEEHVAETLLDAGVCSTEGREVKERATGPFKIYPMTVDPQ
jgi:hypothetical protein